MVTWHISTGWESVWISNVHLPLGHTDEGNYTRQVTYRTQPNLSYDKFHLNSGYTTDTKYVK